jgi:hypothetical protein
LHEIYHFPNASYGFSLGDIIREHEEAMTHKIEICLGCNKFLFGKTMQWKKFFVLVAVR